jgi:N6-adenosine-specific RNA methylase IME4
MSIEFRACVDCGALKELDEFYPPESHRKQDRCKACFALRPRSEERRESRTGVVSPRVQTTEPPGEDMFSTIVADPPWPENQFFRKTGSAKPDDYALLSIDEIIAYTPPAAPDSCLFLWVLNQHIDWGYVVARAWGFEPIQMMTWTKPGGGLGTFQCNTESFLICRKGNMKFNSCNGTYYYWPRGKHSEKPNHFYDLVEKLAPGPYLEMYARRTRENWSHWGNEVEDEGILVGKQPPRLVNLDSVGEPLDINVDIVINGIAIPFKRSK